MTEAERDAKISSTHASMVFRERLLNKLCLPLTLLAGAAAVGLVAAASTALACTLQGIIMCSVLAGVAGCGTAFGFIDKYSDRFGQRALALSMMQCQNNIARAEHGFKQSLPLKGSAVKAFIASLTEGLQERLHIGRPLTLKKKPQPERGI
ncbi:MAG: hypothetical protein EPN97_09755 [Alphaproteobacteria bacterium]|nr:MAG: hypothetical protein EPN97_09755 [Alphaproteobacteria bacterium]